MNLPDGSASAPPQGREKPLCVALVICDAVIEDRRSGNKTLVGLFNGIMAPSLPALHPRLFLMASLTSGTGSWEFSFRVASPSGREVMRMGDVVRFGDPLLVHDLVVEVRNLPLEEAGVYFVDLLLSETPIANRRFTVQVAPDAGAAGT
jgi:hypothetical protein